MGNPTEGFLPPNVTSPAEGQGFISYSVQPTAGDTTGTVIGAQATVIFDAGLADASPLDTPAISNTIDAAAPTSSVSPLPATTSQTSFTVNWIGEDDTGGSGIASYDVYVSDNGGAYTPFVMNATNNSATFTGVDGHTYQFYSVATDNVGNMESAGPGAGDHNRHRGANSPRLGRPTGGNLRGTANDFFHCRRCGRRVGESRRQCRCEHRVENLARARGRSSLGDTTVAAHNGVASFSQLQFSKPGTYVLMATSNGLEAGVSPGFAVTLPAVRLAFAPITAAAAGRITPQVAVFVEDSSGHLVANDQSSVVFTLSSGTFRQQCGQPDRSGSQRRGRAQQPPAAHGRRLYAPGNRRQSDRRLPHREHSRAFRPTDVCI